MVVSFNMLFVSLNAQVKIGNNPTSIGTSSALEVESTNKAVLITRVANTAAITSPVNGMIIYDSTSQCFRCYSNSSWTACLGVGLAASTNGTGIVSSYGASACTVSSINGTMQPGVTVSGVTMSIYANVTALGSYNISSTSNGVTFSGSGTFSALGCQFITLTATGTPVSVGSFTWTTNTLPSTSASANVAIVAGIVTTLDCAGAINNGTLTSGTLANGVSSVLSYTGGNQGSYSAQSVSSTGVTGLTAVLAAGNFASGAGTITFDITGTPSTGGTANFAINVGGQTCTFSRAVVLPVGTITTLNCAGATNIGVPLKGGVAITGVTRIVVPYTGGNGGSYGAQTISSTGVTGVTATLSAGTLANGNGSLTFSLTGTPSGVGTASFVISIGGQSCTATRTVNMDWQITATSLSAAVGNGITYNGISPLNNGLGLRGIGYNGEAVPSGSTIDIAVNASSAGPYNISGTDVTSGLTYSASGNFVNAGLQTITLYNNHINNKNFNNLNYDVMINDSALQNVIIDNSESFTVCNRVFNQVNDFSNNDRSKNNIIQSQPNFNSQISKLDFSQTKSISSNLYNNQISIDNQILQNQKEVLKITEDNRSVMSNLTQVNQSRISYKSKNPRHALIKNTITKRLTRPVSNSIAILTFKDNSYVCYVKEVTKNEDLNIHNSEIKYVLDVLNVENIKISAINPIPLQGLRRQINVSEFKIKDNNYIIITGANKAFFVYKFCFEKSSNGLSYKLISSSSIDYEFDVSGNEYLLCNAFLNELTLNSDDSMCKYFKLLISH